MLAIMSGIGGADLLGHARANDPACVAGAADPCLVDVPQPDRSRSTAPRLSAGHQVWREHTAFSGGRPESAELRGGGQSAVATRCGVRRFAVTERLDTSAAARSSAYLVLEYAQETMRNKCL